MIRRTYKVGSSTITMAFRDITDSGAEILVSSDDSMLSMGGGVSLALSNAGGPRVRGDAMKLVPMNVGDVGVTSAGSLKAKFIIHAVSMGYGARRVTSHVEQVAVVSTATRRAMELVPRLGCRSIAFPAIGTGVAGIPAEVAATHMATTMVDILLDSRVPLEVELYLMDRFGQKQPEDYFVYFEEFTKAHYSLASKRADPAALFSEAQHQRYGPMDPDRPDQVFSILRQLDLRRRVLEGELVAALPTGEPLESLRKPTPRGRIPAKDVRGRRRRWHEAHSRLRVRQLHI